MPIFINSLFPYLAKVNLDGGAKKFIEDARKSIAIAEKEMNYADIAFAHAGTDSESPNLKLAEIARWHCEQSIKHYGEAVTAFDQAAKLTLPAKYKKYIDLKSKKCLEEMAYANTRKIKFALVLRTAN